MKNEYNENDFSHILGTNCGHPENPFGCCVVRWQDIHQVIPEPNSNHNPYSYGDCFFCRQTHTMQ